MGTKKITAVFFASGNGAEPAREWLRTLLPAERKKIGDDIRTVEFGWPIGMPVCRPLGNSLYEVRTSLDRKIARVLFAIEGDHMVLLHGFIKKTQTMPDDDLKLARSRLNDYRRYA